MGKLLFFKNKILKINYVLHPYMGQFPQDGNLALRVSYFWFTFTPLYIHKFAPKYFLKVLGQNSGLLNPKNVQKKSKTPKKFLF